MTVISANPVTNVTSPYNARKILMTTAKWSWSWEPRALPYVGSRLSHPSQQRRLP